MKNEQGWAELRTAAEMFFDAQEFRKGCQSRIRSGSIPEINYQEQLDVAERSEASFKNYLNDVYKRVVPESIREWQSRARGVGEHLLARLLGVIGHPVHTTQHKWVGEGDDRELVVVREFDRRVSDLWSYCGHGDPERKRRKGMSAEDAAACGRPEAKMLTHLIAEGTVKAGVRKHDDAPTEWTWDSRYGISKYGELYQERRIETYKNRDWTPGHCQNDALRIVGKEVLKDLWLAAQT